MFRTTEPTLKAFSLSFVRILLQANRFIVTPDKVTDSASIILILRQDMPVTT